VRLLSGKPLVAWSVIQARASGLFEHVAVSSDSVKILDAAGRAGSDLLIRRPLELATDETDKILAIRHALMEAEREFGRFDTLVDLDATAPLRLPEDIVGAVELAERTGAKSVITGTPARRSPYFNLVERRADGTVRLAKVPNKPIVRRQDAAECFDMNASIYVWLRDTFVEDSCLFYPNTMLYEMPSERSHDVDTEQDMQIVALLFEQLRIVDSLRLSLPNE
jgi:N-acylneuraminate cytidylyltransferase/CMP-N,N'-diacetyllegionaminic acid synthase